MSQMDTKTFLKHIDEFRRQTERFERAAPDAAELTKISHAMCRVACRFFESAVGRPATAEEACLMIGEPITPGEPLDFDPAAEMKFR